MRFSIARIVFLVPAGVVLTLAGLLHSLPSLCNVTTELAEQVTFQELREAKEPKQASTRLPPIGSMGPKGSGRDHFRYYDTLYFISKQFGLDAKSVLEVGCTSDPFIKHLDWVDERTCVAPYSAYGKKSSGQQVSMTKADFYEWKAPKVYDLVLCGQVAEHVEDPKTFVRKLVETAKVAIISVPYMWGPDEKAHHVTDYISLETVEQWTHPKKPVLSTIVQEDRSLRRLIVVYISPTTQP